MNLKLWYFLASRGQEVMVRQPKQAQIQRVPLFWVFNSFLLCNFSCMILSSVLTYKLNRTHTHVLVTYAANVERTCLPVLGSGTHASSCPGARRLADWSDGGYRVSRWWPSCSTQAGAALREEVGCAGEPPAAVRRCKPQWDCAQLNGTWQLWLPPAKLCATAYVQCLPTFHLPGINMDASKSFCAFFNMLVF